MTTLTEHIIVASAENRPPMLEKSMYDSWASRIRLFIKGKKNGRMMLDLIDEGPLVYPMVVGEDGQTRPKKYSELTKAQQLQDGCNVQATNIILHGLPPDVLYKLFDKFASVQGETLYEYYCRLSQLINDIHTIGMTMQQVQVNTKFLNALPPEWREDPINCINKAMTFLSAVASRFQSSNNQLKTSSNPRNQATIQDGRVTVQQVQGIKSQSFAGIGNKGIATTSMGNYTADNEITSDSNIIPYSQYMQESQDAVIQDTNSSAPNDLLVLSLVEQMTDHVANLDKEN
ncbi:hypothetical protein Tco_0240668 [Tanacetum coccineum]